MSHASKTDRWVGSRPLRLVTEMGGQGFVDPRVQTAKIYESLDIVLESLWAHHLKYEVAELGTLLLSSNGKFLADMLEARTSGHFGSRDALVELKNYLAQGNLKPYPGHASVCLFILAQAKTNIEVIRAADLCESISECLGLIQSHLNQGHADDASEKPVIAKLLQRWKQMFPYSE